MIGTTLLACLSMALKDMLGTLMVIAEARGRGWLAGILGGAGDIAQVLVAFYGAGNLILHGWTERTVVLLAAMCVTSVLGTCFWTRVGQRIKGGEA